MQHDTPGRPFAEPSVFETWFDHAERAGPAPGWVDHDQLRSGPAIVTLLVLVICTVPLAAAWVAWQRPPLVGPELASFADQAPDGPAPAQAGAQAPAPFGRLLALLDGTGPAAGTLDEPARVAEALVRIERDQGTAADRAVVCAAVACAALGGPPDRARVRELFSAIDRGLLGPAQAAARTGLSRADAAGLLAALEAARAA